MRVVIPVSQCKVTHNFDKTNIFLKNICTLLCFLGKIGDNKGQNTNIFLKRWCRWCRLCWLFGVSTGAGGRGCRTYGVPALVLWSCVPLVLSALSLCLWGVACKYGSISHSKGVFRGFPLLDVGLCCLHALRGLWGFCVRE